MAKKRRKLKALPTIWRVPDELWNKIKPIISKLDPPKWTGRKRIDPRGALDAIIFRMRTGCQWNQLPKELPRRQFGASHLSTLDSAGVAGQNMGGSGGELQRTGRGGLAVAGGRYGYGQGAFWGDVVGPNPTDRAKNGVKRSLLVEGDGGPLAVVVAGANVHDTKMLAVTIEAIVVQRPTATEDSPQNLCLDKGYDNPTGWEAATGHDYTPHIRRIGEEKLDTQGRKKCPPRRWVVERTLSWLSKCRAILVRYEKKASNYLNLIKLACALFWYRRLWRLTVLR